LQALAKGDIKAVSVLADPLKIPLHNFYELVWLLKTGFPRLMRMVSGKEKFVVDEKILNEGYNQAAPYVRTRQIGHNTQRRPEIINNIKTYKHVVGGKIGELITKGPDRFSKPYTPQGRLPSRRSSSVPIPHRRSKFVPPRPVDNRWKPLL